MPINLYEIRVCNSCGLRYPLMQGHAFGVRCPHCMGETRIILSRELVADPMPRPASFLSPTKRKTFAVLLDNIRSAWNVGSILRTADGFGLDHAYLCGITPTPENEAVTKTSLGAEESVVWSHHKDAVKLVEELKKDSWMVLGLEEDERSKELSRASTLKASQHTLLIVGNEITGVDPGLLALCDNIFHIPMRGKKKSFNAAMAFSIATYALR